ncbi:hypothetical protein [Amycolatopsis orientalis]|uniref:hypothetical protein n=1 Tax=Amycolatopsis orientalis TaxID=31958 RepID=UPI0003A08494|nr:hypothetical protein [Amycolatopsis orientalis]
MADNPLSLPEVFGSRHGAELRAALVEGRRTGDFSRARQIANHLAAEIRETPAFLFALRLQTLALEASDDGRDEEAQAYHDILVRTCSRDTIRRVGHLRLLGAGLRQGWLTAADHDRLREDFRSHPTMLRILAGIERRGDPGQP